MQFSIANSLTLLALASSALALPTFQQETDDFSAVSNSSSTVSDPHDKTPGSAGSWTVILDNDDPRTLSEMLDQMNLNVDDLTHVYNNSAFKGFAGSLSNHHVTSMKNMTGLKTYEPEMEIATYDSQTNAPWGLERISEASAISNAPTSEAAVGAYDFSYKFSGSSSSLGQNVDVYMVDTGINTQHVDFDGRAKFGFAFDGNETDDEGHGTHTAGTVGSTTFGVAKAVNLIAVKVLSSSSGTSSDILKGIDWLINNHDTRKTQSNWAGSVASMSLGSPSRSSSIEEAVSQASQAGIHFSVAAGNENQDACNSSPAAVASSSDVVSVGATTIQDARASFSNFGTCTTVYAPGQDITSTWIGGTNKINTISGTSMACPHVSGLMAYLLAVDSSLKTDTAGMKAKILSLAESMTIDKGTVKFINNGITS